MLDYLLKAMAESDLDGVSQWWKKETPSGDRAWAIHLALFPVVQRVLNPPFINPHLPKMYRICREFLPYLEEADIPSLVWLEVNEYAARPKLEPLPLPARQDSPVSFTAIQAAIRENDPAKSAALLRAFLEQKGKVELARNLLLLGSGYLEQSLGHSVSCTAFILLEIMERIDQDPWPALTLLADYFCKGQFHTVLPIPGKRVILSQEALSQHLLRAASGNGIVNLHHTITRYSIERVRHLFSEAEYAHLIARWIEFIGHKDAETPPPAPSGENVPEYQYFYQTFSGRDEKQVLLYLGGMLPSTEGRRTMGYYLVKGVCDLYHGQYNPHFLTGLSSALWVANEYHKQPPVAMNALRQYVNYFFSR
ncbi:MAG: hypothetical protein HYX84_05235 [Chloroflexi bacterium]|nr:hypothetical protein [Chloroflexota bacterium]